MSMTTHRFHSVQTLARAQEWLGQIGITPDRIEVSSTGLPSMTVQTEFSRLPEVEMVINAAELTDPEGWPAHDAIGVYAARGDRRGTQQRAARAPAYLAHRLASGRLNHDAELPQRHGSSSSRASVSRAAAWAACSRRASISFRLDGRRQIAPSAAPSR